MESVLGAISRGELSKAVLAQRLRLRLAAAADPVRILLRLHAAANGHAAAGGGEGGGANQRRGTYLFLLELSPGLAFIGCTPELLFRLRSSANPNEDDVLHTEAIAGTRRRGATVEEDARLAAELEASLKDRSELDAVSIFLEEALGDAGLRCSELRRSDATLLQLRHVQHMKVTFAARLARPAAAVPYRLADGSAGSATEGGLCRTAAVLPLLHPTPAVCGTPREAARATLARLEPFDRGYYAGPLGHISSEGCEFCVGIRSALVHGDTVSLYAGAGLVEGSVARHELDETQAKMKDFTALFPPAPHPAPPVSAPAPPPSSALKLVLQPSFEAHARAAENLNVLWAAVLIEELRRGGLAHVVLCPGSRCAPLTVAVARSGLPHSLATDERGAAFLALGLARATGRCCAVLVSSGTAVANLLPAVVEAAADHVPLLLLSADRPPELRDTGANQTVQQVGMLAPLRWFKDMPCPEATAPLEPLLSDASYALARACGAPRGPVHLNCMLREPLAPTAAPWADAPLRAPRIAKWLVSGAPFTAYVAPCARPHASPDAPLLQLAAALRGARRGVLVAGALRSDEARHAVCALGARLGWPVLPDVNSGLRRPRHRHGARLAPRPRPATPP